MRNVMFLKIMNSQQIPKECKNKCDCCGLKQIYPPDTGKLFQDLKILFDKGIINQTFPRKLYPDDVNDRDEFCLVANPSWKNKDAPCDNWILFHPDLKKSDYLMIAAQKESIRAQLRTEELAAQTKDLAEKTEALNRTSLKVARATRFIAIIALGLSLLLGGIQISLMLRPLPTTTSSSLLTVQFYQDHDQASKSTPASHNQPNPADKNR